MADPLPGKGFWGWLGRQVGYVRAANKTEVTSEKLYEQKHVQEQPHPEDPNVTLRRTTIDEVVRKRPDQKQ